MMAAMAPALKDLSSDQDAVAVGGLLSELATKRASGQDAVLIAFEVPEGARPPQAIRRAISASSRAFLP
ncbi:hypothetical protein FHS87_004137 [Roseomonas pecuniae]|uniref:Uncharacterized protein n=1 Tax=Muricoccus pecuniae TaxID=693023 RepID=A0A840YBI1_9PROT|nr:hypothetical protein [Roseomonas pecuniae]